MTLAKKSRCAPLTRPATAPLSLPGGSLLVSALVQFSMSADIHFSSTSFTAVDDGQIVGFLIGFVSQTFPDQAYIHFLGVHPARRGEGLGRLLYERFFAAAASLGCRTAQCVTAPVNRNSIAFHRRIGFSLLDSEYKVDGVPVAVGYDGEDEDRVIFKKDLDTLNTVR